MRGVNSLFRRILDGFRGRTAKTPISTDLNRSPRQVNINESRTTRMSDASAKGESSPKFYALQKGGSVVARGNKLARNKPTKLY
jgi:hypothetical protein